MDELPVMSIEKDVLPTLCRCIGSLINVTLTTEQLSLAKYNAPDSSGAEALRSTLHVLSHYAVREKLSNVNFQHYDTWSAVKLHFAFLRYPAMEFYSLSQDDNQNRLSLIALAWLLGTQDALTITLRAKLANNASSTEFSRVNPLQPASLDIRNDQPLSMDAQLDSILHLNGKVNQNFKEISELMCERGKLMCKAHEANIQHLGEGACSLEDVPHLSVSELALIKRATTIGGGSTAEDRQRLQELRNTEILLEAHAKWLSKRHIFFDWMATVLSEHRRSALSKAWKVNSRQLIAFISLLRCVINGKLLTSREASLAMGRSLRAVLDCPFRVQKSECSGNITETQNWSDKLKVHQNVEESHLQQQRERLAAELKEMLQLIPSCVHV